MRNRTCRFCGSPNIVKAGKRKNLHSEKQRWLCRSCGRRFTQDDGFLHLWYEGEMVSKAIDLYWTGLSCRTASSFLERHEARAPGKSTVHRWIHRFASLVRGFISRLRPGLSGRWYADEMFTSLEGKPALVWEVMDGGTRFWLCALPTEGRVGTERQAEQALAEALENAKERPRDLLTDGSLAYIGGGRWVLGWRRVRLVRRISYYQGWNNLMERKIQTTRWRTRLSRGLGSLARGWLEGFRIHYNFVREHMGLGRTPAEAAGLDLPLLRNRWLGLIWLAV